MSEVNLLRSLPKSKRNLKERKSQKTEHHIKVSRQYGEEYFDGSRDYGYGGYTYDGRWKTVAKDIVEIYDLKKNDKVLDIGCGKGFLVKDLLEINIDAFGLDISDYAIKKSEMETYGRIHKGNAISLPFPNNSFDFVLSINTIHNLVKDDVIVALKEIERVSKGKSFVQVDSYKTLEQKEVFEEWVLTAQYHDYPEGWLNLFKKAGFKGDWYWTIID